METSYKLTTEDYKLIAAEIIAQLGGKMFLVMVGAQNMTFDSSNNDGNLSFKFRGSTVAAYCKIVLDPSDTYTVTFTSARGKTVKEYDGVYCDMLQSIFTSVTGLYTHL